MLASEKGQGGCLELLIAAGANLEHQNEVCESYRGLWTVRDVGELYMKLAGGDGGS